MSEFDQRLHEYQTFIESYLEENCFVNKAEPQQVLFDAMRYSLLAGGKRLRPALVMEFARVCGSKWQKAAPFAAAIEMVHTYSLIHDDLPSMDNDDYRRGRLTNHKVYGEATAILAGDALLTASFGWLMKAETAPEQKVRAAAVLSECAGELGMVGGQILDMAAEDRTCTEQEILDVQNRKTGALIRAACQLGVIAAGGSEAQMEASKGFADHLGLAFQIRDDILDVIGDAKTLGKAVGADGSKNTFVRLYGLEKCQDLVQQHTNTAISYLNVFSDTEWLKMLAESLVHRTI